MNKKFLIFFIVLPFVCQHVNAQSQEAQQLMLDVQKLASLKNILTDLKKSYNIIWNGYNSIKNISEGNFNLHQAFLNSLLQVSPVIKKYYRVADIVSRQAKMIKDYKSAFALFKSSDLFSGDEISYMTAVFKNLFNQSVKSLDDLVMVLTAGKLRMTDDERMKNIDNIWSDVDNQISFLKHFNNNTKVLGIQRAREQNDISAIHKLYNIN